MELLAGQLIIPTILLGVTLAYSLHKYNMSRLKNKVKSMVGDHDILPIYEKTYFSSWNTDSKPELSETSLSPRTKKGASLVKYASALTNILNTLDSLLLKSIIPLRILDSSITLSQYLFYTQENKKLEEELKRLRGETEEIVQNTWKLAQERHRLAKTSNAFVTFLRTFLPSVFQAVSLATIYPMTEFMLARLGNTSDLVKLVSLGWAGSKASEAYKTRSQFTRSLSDQIKSIGYLANEGVANVGELNRFSVLLRQKLRETSDRLDEINAKKRPSKVSTLEKQIKKEEDLMQEAAKSHKQEMTISEMFSRVNNELES